MCATRLQEMRVRPRAAPTWLVLPEIVRAQTQRRPLLYLDVDGVLFGYYDGYPQLRPGAVSFLRWATEHFQVTWLTTWPYDRLQGLFTHLMAKSIFDLTLYQSWRSGADKTSGIDPQSDFYWVEDGILPEELAWLQSHSRIDRYYNVDPNGAAGLVAARAWLEEQLHKEIKPSP